MILVTKSCEQVFFFIETDVLVSCTLDLPDEKCPLNNLNDWRIGQASQSDGNQPITDHTRGGKRKIFIFDFLCEVFFSLIDTDGKYFLITGNRSRLLNTQKLQLGPILHSNSSNAKHHCLQFWYSAYGQGQGKLRIGGKKSEKDDVFMTNNKNQGKLPR